MDMVRSRQSAVEIVAARDGGGVAQRETGKLRGDVYLAVIAGEALAKMCEVAEQPGRWAVSVLARPQQPRLVDGEGAARDLVAELAEQEIARRAGVTR